MGLRIFLVIALPVEAASFASASLMLERNKVSQSDVQILVIIEPSPATTSRTETSFTLAFATGFTVNGTASAIHTSTAAVPTTYQGHTLVAMPGVGSAASGVSGQTVTFASSNLSTGNYYAFYITSGITTPSSTGKYVHTLSTIDGSGTIDTQQIGTNIVANDQIGVSATVQPLSTDGSVVISASPSTSTTLIRGDEAVITLTYQSTLASSQNMEIVASWDKGYLAGSPTSEVTAVTYKVGSATNTDTSVAPVVDLTNRTITWTVPSVTPNIAHTVSFTLTTSSSLTSITPLVVQAVRANATLINTSLATSSLSYNINFYIANTVTPTSAPGPTATPTPSTTTSETTTTTEITSLVISNVAMRTIAKDAAKLILTTSREASYTLFYGLEPKKLTNTIVGLDEATQHSIEIVNLAPSTKYYFRIVAKAIDGSQATSDIFTFTTADADQLVNILFGTVLWKQLPLASVVDQSIGGTAGLSAENTLLFVPMLKPLVFTFRFDHPERISSATVRIQDSRVLGISTYAPAVHLYETQLLESLPGYFTGELSVPASPGLYHVFLEVSDISHGVKTQELPYDVYVSSPLRVTDKKTGKPIENARVNILRYEEYRKVFTPLEKLIPYNPLTNERGEVDIALPQGSYIYEVSAPGYISFRKEVRFDNNQTDYPHFELESAPFLVGTIAKQLSSFGNAMKYIRMHAKEFSISPQAQRIVRDAGLLLAGLLFIALEYYRKFEHVLVHKVRRSFAAWVLFQSVNIMLSLGALLFILVFAAMVHLVGIEPLFLHGIILCAMTLLWGISIYYAWQILIQAHE